MWEDNVSHITGKIIINLRSKIMNAEKYSFQKEENKRKQLWEIIPLEFPFALDFMVSHVCNFKCFYCLQAERDGGTCVTKKGKQMSFEVFKKCIDHISRQGKLKVLTMSGLGEPLVNKDIVNMVKYAVDSQVADSVEIVTNASLLTNELSEKLVEAGLNRLRVSLQGLSSKEYKNVSGVNLDYDKLRSNIRYFYSIREKTILYIKVMDFMVKDAAIKKKFYDDFSEYCDQINIENLVPLYKELDFSVAGSKFDKSLYGGVMLPCKVCTRPFFHCAIDYDGAMLPCCILPEPIVYGNAAENFDEGWNGKVRIEFLLDMLKENTYKYKTCSTCVDARYRTRETDILDHHLEELIKKFECYRVGTT